MPGRGAPRRRIGRSPLRRVLAAAARSLLLLLSLGGVAVGQQVSGGQGELPPIRRPVLRPPALAGLPSPDSVRPLVAAAADTLPPALEIGAGRVPLLWEPDLLTETAEQELQLPLYFEVRPPWQSTWQRRFADRIARRADTLWLASLNPQKVPHFRSALVPVDTTGLAFDTLQKRGPGEIGEILPSALSNVANLKLELEGQGQFASQWQSFQPCLLGQARNCNSGAVPILRPDFQLRALAKGTISDRIHVDVDYDQTREFSANNNINVYYQGKTDEILQRVEVGDVTLPLPPSSFISKGIPAGNFGVHTQAQMGPLSLQTVYAEQGGDVQNQDVTLNVGGGQQSQIRDQSTVLNDGDYQTGQFFFLVDPRLLRGYPDLDVLNLSGSEAPASLRPTSAIKLYRHEVTSGSQPQNVESGVIQARAVAVRPPGADSTLPDSTEFRGFFKPMVEGQDFIVDKSGLWVVIRSTIQRDEALAVTYIAANGDTVGDFDAEAKYRQLTNTGQGELPRLVLLKDATTHRPGGITWKREMHQIYRISSSDDIQEGSISLTISQGPDGSGPVIRTVDGVDFTFLEIFGLDDQPRDDRVDAGRIWRPSSSATASGSPVITGSYLVFPTLEPFESPPPLQASRVDSLQGKPFPLSEGDRSRAIYEEPNDQTRANSSLYSLNFDYKTLGTGSASTISLGAIGIRDGSEKVTLNGQELVRGQDYTINYDIGQLTLLHLKDLTGASGQAQLNVRFEQKPLFQVAPTSVLGFTGKYQMGEWGKLNFIGLSQNEKSILTRPELGLEPGGVKIGGLSGQFDFPVPALTSFANALPGVNTDRPSRLTLNGEVATSLPTTNRQGTTYVDDFEGSSGQKVQLDQRDWRFGSRLTRPDVGAAFLPATLDATSLARISWQSQFLQNGQVNGPLLSSQIDPALRIQGAEQQEPVLWLSMNAPASSSETKWATITTSLSETGLDLTTSEFLQFYASTLGNDDPGMALIIDVGTVSEDAFVLDSTGVPSGLGVLNQEANPNVGVWGNQDDTGLWGRGCTSEPQATAFPLGDVRANCARNNGREDTEDMNRDNFLNTDERFYRFVVPLNQSSRYLNRKTNGEFQFSFYKIPLREPDLKEAMTDEDLQNVRQIRITVVSTGASRVLLSRMEFSGSPWLKRGGSGSVAGTIGQQPGSAGNVSVGPISTRDAAYVSPPGISNQVADKTSGITGQSSLFNETSLRLGYSDIPAGERVEVYRRFPQTSRSFLDYREMRAWAIAPRGDWGNGSPLRFYIRLGFDQDNFYLYRTPLPSSPANPSRADWNPEVRVDFNRWIALRAAAEQIILNNGGRLPGDSTMVLWDVDVFPNGDSTYAVAISDRSRAPNLAAIREMVLGVQNTGSTDAPQGEVWIDDLRLDAAADRTGLAERGELQMSAGDVIGVHASYDRRDPFFRQLGQSPSYQANWDFNGTATVSLGRFLPDALGISMPFQVTHSRGASDPYFLPSTDIPGAKIRGLRTGEDRRTVWSVGLSHRERSGSPILRATIDGLSLNFRRTTNSSVATQSETTGKSWSASMDWQRSVVDESFRVVPGFVRDFIDLLPDFISQSTLFKNFKDLRFRWTPDNLSLGNALDRSDDEVRRFQSSVRTARDQQVAANVSRDFNLRSNAGIGLQPFPSVSLGVNVSSIRDLVPPAFRVDGAAGRRLLRAQQRQLGGIGIGWETDRTISTSIDYQPHMFTWLDPGVSIQTNSRTSRNASYVLPVNGDTTLVRDLQMSRQIRVKAQARPRDFLTSLGIPEADKASGIAGGLRAVFNRFQPVQFNWNKQINANFDRRDIGLPLSNQFVTVGIADLRSAGGQPAATAGKRVDWSLNGSYQLPLSLDANVGYSHSQSVAYSALSNRGNEDTTWPDVSLRWRELPLPGFFDHVVDNLSLTAGVKDRSTISSTTTGQNLGQDQTTYSLSSLFVFRNGFNLSYEFDRNLTDITDATGSTQRNTNGHTVRFTGTVPAPGFIGFARRPLRLTLSYSRNGNFECRDIGGSGFQGSVGGGLGGFLTGVGCTPDIDQVTQNASLSIDTDFQGYTLGVELSWDRRGSAVGQRLTTTQYNLNIFGRFFFRSGEAAGTMQGLPPGGP